MTRYCKLHYIGDQSEHWGLLDRKSFAGKDAKPHFMPDVLLAPCHLKLDLNFDWGQERVWGTTLHEIEVKNPKAERIMFDAVHLDVADVRIGGRKVEFENTGEKVIVPLKGNLKTGQILKVSLKHSVTRPVAGIYFTKPDPHYPDRFKTVWTQGQDEDSRYYFPCFDQPNFKQTTEVILHLPKGMFGLSNGRLLKKKEMAHESYFHYKLELPYSTYLLSIVAGEFVEGKDRWKDVSVHWYVEKGREKEGKNSFKDTARILKFFSDYTGYKYPYRQYTQIAVPEFIFGGMENFTVTTQTDLTLHDDRAALDIDSNGLVAHEAAHMWFGDVVTAKSWGHAWLHESFATYFDALYTRESKGEDEFRYQVLEDAETYFSEDSRYRRPIVTNIYKEPIDLFDAHLYPGGAVRLHHLKHIVGETDFKKALNLFLKRHEYNLVETVDLARCLEETTHHNYDNWLAQWIYRGGYPQLELKYNWDANSQLATVTIKQTQKAEKKDESLLFDLPLKIVFYHARGEEEFVIPVREKNEKFCFKLKRSPLYFRLDPEYVCPCKKIKLDVSRLLLHEQLKRDPDPIGRIEAVAALSKDPSERDIRALSRQLKQETFWGVGERIASALGKIGGDLARDGLIRALKVENPKIRRGVVQALGQFPQDEKVIRKLKQVASGDPSYRVEAMAFLSLGKLREPTLRPFLEAGIPKASHNDMVRVAIYNALGQLELKESWPMLVAGAEYGAPKMSRGSAMAALAKIAKRHEHLGGEAMQLFRRFAKENRGTPAAVFRGKLWAIQSMQSLGDLAAVSVLRELAEREPDGRLKRRAQDAANALMEGAKKPREMKQIRSDLDDIIKENKSLRDRLDTMDKKSSAGKKSKSGKG